MATKKKPRVLIAKLGLDGHDRGAKLVAHALKESGIEVIYLGIRHTIDQVAETAVREKVEYVGLSFMAGDHMTMIPKLIDELNRKNADKVKIILGGIIARDQIPELKAMGVQEVFLPGTPLDRITAYIKENLEHQE